VKRVSGSLPGRALPRESCTPGPYLALYADRRRSLRDPNVLAESLHYHGLEHGYHHERYHHPALDSPDAISARTLLLATICLAGRRAARCRRDARAHIVRAEWNEPWPTTRRACLPSAQLEADLAASPTASSWLPSAPPRRPAPSLVARRPRPSRLGRRLCSSTMLARSRVREPAGQSADLRAEIS